MRGVWMKIYISIDLEGLPGISSLLQVAPGLSLYNDAREIMTWVVNVLAKELRKGGADEITVADSHGYMANIRYLDIEERVKFIQGYPRPFSMVIGLEKGYDGVMFVGYHAAAGTREGFLDHTYSSRVIYKVYVNEVQASEYLLNALYAGQYGVPVILVAGDERLREEVERFTPHAVFIGLKKGLGRIAAEYYSKDVIEKELREGVKEALRRLKEGELKPLKFDHYDLKIELREAIYADMAQIIPGMRRVDAYTLEYKAKDAKEALGIVELIAWVGNAGAYLVQSMYR
jgi:D-amino peptidase